MAIDKSNTKPAVKVLIWVLIVAFVLSGTGLGFASFYNLFQAQPASQTTSSASQIPAINSTNEITIKELKRSAESTPASFTALVSLGNAYIDWASQVQAAAFPPGSTQQTKVSTEVAQQISTLFYSARDTYALAIKLNPNDAAVLGDYSVALYYTGDTPGAIKAALAALKINPKFAQVQFNVGNFYADSGDKAKAIAAYQSYLKLEPTGDKADAAKKNIEQLQTGK